MRKTLRTTTAVLAFPVLINAVALSDMTPRAQNLPPACANLYTAQIAGCTEADWKSGQCSPSCSSSMQALVAPIVKACGGQGVTGQNLVVAYLAGVGPQQLCHNIGSETTATPTPTPTTSYKTKPTLSPTIVSSSTSTARTLKSTGSVIVDSSSSTRSETSKSKTTAGTTTKKKTTATPESSTIFDFSSSAAATTGKSTGKTTSPSRTKTAQGNSQTNFNDHSGGGSPFDTPGNLANAASGLSASVASLVLPALAAALFAVMR